jgi:NADPH-dependent 2,4-dienoyl-CoA reductase/sulfur reductase-like enzyme
LALKRSGIERVLLFEREIQAGGVPRHCGHPPFGLREFGRILDGPTYAKRLVERACAAGVETHTGHSVVVVEPGARFRVVSPEGIGRESTGHRP